MAVAATETGGAALLPLADDGTRTGPIQTAGTADEVVAAVAQREAATAPRRRGPRWAPRTGCSRRVFASGVLTDIELTEALLSGHAGRWGEPRGLPAVWARLHDLPVPPDPPLPEPRPPGLGQGTLFDAPHHHPYPSEGFDPLEALVEAYASQVARIAAVAEPGRFHWSRRPSRPEPGPAAETGYDGLPRRADAHDEVLVELADVLRRAADHRAGWSKLNAAISTAFGGAPIHPKRPAEVLLAFSREGIGAASNPRLGVAGRGSPRDS